MVWDEESQVCLTDIVIGKRRACFQAINQSENKSFVLIDMELLSSVEL